MVKQSCRFMRFLMLFNRIRRYTYTYDDQEGSHQVIDAHHIFVQQNTARGFLLCLTILLLLANTFFLLLLKEKPGIHFFWSNLLAVVAIKSVHSKSIKKESVVIMPGLGVQLEKHFGSRKVVRRFVPIEKILKPVLNECVTPITCYWTLGLIVHGDAELLLVFEGLQPPVKMLVPVWKALCAASDSEENMDTIVENDH